MAEPISDCRLIQQLESAVAELERVVRLVAAVQVAPGHGYDLFHSDPTNSTFFTTCCRVAICDNQQQCPVCRKDVYPFYEGMSEKERDEAAGGYYHHNTQMARWSMARRSNR